MKTKIIEAGQSAQGPNWGKFLLGRFDVEWSRRSGMYEAARKVTDEMCGEGTYEESNGVSRSMPLLSEIGWGRNHLWVLDLQTGEGAYFSPGGYATADLDKHKIWVCPMFEPFLAWLYKQDLTDLDALPDFVELPDAPFHMQGFRRAGVDG